MPKVNALHHCLIFIFIQNKEIVLLGLQISKRYYSHSHVLYNFLLFTSPDNNKERVSLGLQISERKSIPKVNALQNFVSLYRRTQ
jgi:hypothetical protein